MIQHLEGSGLDGAVRHAAECALQAQHGDEQRSPHVETRTQQLLLGGQSWAVEA